MEVSREIVVAIRQFFDDQSNVRKHHLNNLVQFCRSEVVHFLAAQIIVGKAECS